MSDWAETPTDIPDQTGYEASPSDQFTPTAPDENTYQDINTYNDFVASLFDLGGTSTGNGIGSESGLISRGSSAGQEISGAGNKGAATGTGGEGWLDDIIKSAKTTFGWDEKTDPRVKAAALTIGAGAIGGIGKAITDRQKLALEEKKINTDTMLAQTQADIAKQKMANQAGPLTFNQPGLIGGRIAKITPIQSRIPQ